MALALDGSVHANASTQDVVVNLTTTQAGDYIIVSVVSNGGPTLSVSSVALGAFTLLASIGVNASTPVDLWAAFSPAALSADAITVHQTSGGFCTVDAFGVSGSNQKSLVFDAGGPQTGHVDPVPITTVNVNTFVIGAMRFQATATPTDGSGFTGISGANFSLVEFEVLSSAQTLSVTATTGALDANGVVVIAIPMALPFNQTDWAKPQRIRASPIDLSRPLNLAIFKNPIPFAQYDWSKPKRVPASAVDQSRPLNLNLFKNPIPFAKYDWDKPTRQPPSFPPAQPLNLNLLGITVSVPFNQTDWSKPFYPRRAISPPDTININLLTNPIPFAQYDWSKPYRIRQARFSPDQALNINIFKNPIPFSQTGLALPIRPMALPATAQPFNPNLYGVVSIPFNQFDYPASRRLRANQAQDIQNFILISVAPGAPPVVHDRPFFATVGRLMGTP